MNWIYDILAELQTQGKKIILCKLSAHTGIKENKVAYEAAKQAINMPGMITSEVQGTRNSKGNRKTALVSYTILNHTSKNGKVHTTAVGNMRSNWAGYGLDTLV